MHVVVWQTQYYWQACCTLEQAYYSLYHHKQLKQGAVLVLMQSRRQTDQTADHAGTMNYA